MDTSRRAPVQPFTYLEQAAFWAVFCALLAAVIIVWDRVT